MDGPATSDCTCTDAAAGGKCSESFGSRVCSGVLPVEAVAGVAVWRFGVWRFGVWWFGVWWLEVWRFVVWWFGVWWLEWSVSECSTGAAETLVVRVLDCKYAGLNPGLFSVMITVR